MTAPVNIGVMKKRQVKIARAIICLVVLVVAQGCSSLLNRESGKSWSQIAAEAEREQQLGEPLQGDWDVLP